ncbi:MAG: hypothetical protein LQ340_001858 [Diploschistes diacapsis]|nr:MAG: hypothetical protein LQ340_001858 [Diploschistes diacapsis]
MDLLILDSVNDDPVVKSVKGISSVSTLTKPTVTTPGGGTGGPGTLVHTNTSTSAISNGSGARSLITTTVLDSPNDKILYPFRVKHLGKTEVYILYASSAQNRQEWCDKIIEAKTRHASSLFAQNAEPFKLRVLADTAFAYDSQSGGPKGVIIKGTPLDRSIEECEKSFYGTGPKPSPVCRAQVNCATTFNQPFGKRMIAVGTDFGVFISEDGNARAWTRVVNATHVTQVAVIEDFSLFIIISDKSLIAYHLETVCPVGGAGTAADSRKAPQKLSGNRDVGFFAVGRQKDRTLVFYKKKDGISSTFKVLEPVYQKSATSTRSRFAIRRGTTDFFRDFDDFYIPSETYAIDLFQSSLAISTARGIEILTLDKKVPISVPDLKPPEVASIAQRIQNQKPLGMFRLSDNEFLLVFEEVGIYVDKHGDVSRAVVMEFVGKAKQACLIGGMYLILVDAGAGFVEVRNAVNGRLRQVISGRDVKLLDAGQTSGTVKICMQHPEQERNQVVLEMLVNEGSKE